MRVNLYAAIFFSFMFGALSGCGIQGGKHCRLCDQENGPAMNACRATGRVGCDKVETNGVIHSEWIVDAFINKSIIANLPVERALIFDVCDPGRRVLLNNSEKKQLRWCLEGARIEERIPINPGVFTIRDYDYVLGVGEICKCKDCQELQKNFCSLVGPNWGFVQSVVEVYLSKDGDSDIKFENEEKQRRFLEIIVPKIQLLPIDR
jgi:hypothetical protein